MKKSKYLVFTALSALVLSGCPAPTPTPEPEPTPTPTPTPVVKEWSAEVKAAMTEVLGFELPYIELANQQMDEIDGGYAVEGDFDAEKGEAYKTTLEAFAAEKGFSADEIESLSAVQYFKTANYSDEISNGTKTYIFGFECYEGETESYNEVYFRTELDLTYTDWTAEQKAEMLENYDVVFPFVPGADPTFEVVDSDGEFFFARPYDGEEEAFLAAYRAKLGEEWVDEGDGLYSAKDANVGVQFYPEGTVYPTTTYLNTYVSEYSGKACVYGFVRMTVLESETWPSEFVYDLYEENIPAFEGGTKYSYIAAIEYYNLYADILVEGEELDLEAYLAALEAAHFTVEDNNATRMHRDGEEDPDPVVPDPHTDPEPEPVVEPAVFPSENVVAFFEANEVENVVVPAYVAAAEDVVFEEDDSWDGYYDVYVDPTTAEEMGAYKDLLVENGWVVIGESDGDYRLRYAETDAVVDLLDYTADDTYICASFHIVPAVPLASYTATSWDGYTVMDINAQKDGSIAFEIYFGEGNFAVEEFEEMNALYPEVLDNVPEKLINSIVYPSEELLDPNYDILVEAWYDFDEDSANTWYAGLDQDDKLILTYWMYGFEDYLTDEQYARLLELEAVYYSFVKYYGLTAYFVVEDGEAFTTAYTAALEEAQYIQIYETLYGFNPDPEQLDPDCLFVGFEVGANGVVKFQVQLMYEVPALQSIELSGTAQTEFYVGDTFSYEGLVVSGIYAKGEYYTYREEVEGYTVSTPDMSEAGEKEVTVTYTEGETEVTATYTISVVEKPVPPQPTGAVLDLATATMSDTNNYSSQCDITTEAGNWTAQNGNNNAANAKWSYLKFGSKNEAKTSFIQSEFAVGGDSITVQFLGTSTHKNATLARLTAVKVYVSDTPFEGVCTDDSKLVATVANADLPTLGAAGCDLTIALPEGTSGYIQVVFETAQGSNNGEVIVQSITIA